MVNCKTTNILRGNAEKRPVRNVPLSTITALKPDK